MFCTYSKTQKCVWRKVCFLDEGRDVIWCHWIKYEKIFSAWMRKRKKQWCHLLSGIPVLKTKKKEVMMSIVSPKNRYSNSCYIKSFGCVSDSIEELEYMGHVIKQKHVTCKIVFSDSFSTPLTKRDRANQAKRFTGRYERNIQVRK